MLLFSKFRDLLSACLIVTYKRLVEALDAAYIMEEILQMSQPSPAVGSLGHTHPEKGMEEVTPVSHGCKALNDIVLL